MFCGSGGVGKTSVAAAAALGAATASRRQGARAHDRPRAPARDRARPRGHRQSRAPRAARSVEGRRCRGARRAVGRDARHEAVVGRSRAAPRDRRGDRVPHPREPALPQPHRALRAEPRLHRDGAAATRSTRAASTTSSSSTRRRRGTRSTSSRRPRAWPTSSAAGCCAGSRSRTASAASVVRACINVASRPFYQMADRILGSKFLQDIAEFFLNFQSMYDGFVERAHAVERLLHDRRTTFAVVTTLEAAPLHEAEHFCQRADRAQLPSRRARPEQDVARLACVDPTGAAAATACIDDAAPIADALAATGDPALADPDAHRAGAADDRRVVPELLGRRDARGRAARRARARPRRRRARPDLRRRHRRRRRPRGRSAGISSPSRRRDSP